MINGAQRIYMFGEDNKPMKSKKDLEVEERLRLMKLKMEEEVIEDELPPITNPYHPEYVKPSTAPTGDEDE